MSQGSYADVNGLHLYNETQGDGQPLILLPGGYGNTEMFGPVREALAQGRQVIAVDLQGHGRTADIDRPLRFETMADDIAGLIESLGFDQVDLMGDSLGGGVALRTAIQHPQKIRKLILVSTPFKQSGWFPEVLEAMRWQAEPGAGEKMGQGFLYETYIRLAPRPEDWPVLVNKMGTLLSHPYDWSGEISKIQAQTLLAYADHDSISPVHMAEFFQLLGGGLKDAGWDNSGMTPNRLTVLPGLSHYNIFTSPRLAEVAIQFLQEPVPQASR